MAVSFLLNYIDLTTDTQGAANVCYSSSENVENLLIKEKKFSIRCGLAHNFVVNDLWFKL